MRSQLDPADEAYPAQRRRYIVSEKSARAEAADWRAGEECPHHRRQVFWWNIIRVEIRIIPTESLRS